MINNKRDMKHTSNTPALKALFAIGFGLLLAGLPGCYRDKADQVYPGTGTGTTTCDTANITYSGTIKAIVDQHCAIAGCHDGSNASTYDMRTYEGIYYYCVSTNKLLGSIRHDNGFVAMPQGAAKLDDCTINKITSWVNNGALNN
jgi:hypothetical protein